MQTMTLGRNTLRKAACGFLALMFTGMAQATPYYVNINQLNDGGDGLTWGTAKKSIQAAVDIANATEIVVTNGTYLPISTANKAVTIRSVNGAEHTIIDGGGISRCATLGSSSSHVSTTLRGFTLQNGYASGNNGGGSAYGTLNDCILTGNTASGIVNGGGSYYGVLYNCILTNNTATGTIGGVVYGGGAAYSELHNCTLTDNKSASLGGGSYRGTLYNCTLSGNSANNNGGGSCESTLYNCLLTSNVAQNGGGASGGTLVNCTLTGNKASASGGGVHNSTLRNSIVWGNFYTLGTFGWVNNYSGGTFVNSCTRPLPSGTGNIAEDPLFLDSANGYFQLQAGSPCINTGNNSYDSGAGSTDLDGNPRRNGIVDMGAYEYSASAVRKPVARTVTLFVSPSGNDAANGTSWATAKRTIQAAINAAPAVCEIVVTNGTYAPISTANKAVTIRSVNGAVVTIIDGGGTTRCATLGAANNHANTVLVGFTLRNGYVSGNNGGGSYGGTLNDCILTGNTASGMVNGGGSYYGVLYNCILTNNTATGTIGGAVYGGGAAYSDLYNCTLTDNKSASLGGGAYNCMLVNCLLTGNSANSSGGGTSGGTLYNCTLSRNTSNNGGGSSSGTLYNCIVWGNTTTGGAVNEYSGGTFTYSCSTPRPTGTGNINDDPRFINAAANDFRLNPDTSPCIGGGNNANAYGVHDLDGNPRIRDVVDMGCYEYQPPITVIVTYNPNGGSVSPTSKSVVSGQTYGTLPTPTRTGYTFEGWWTALSGGTEVTSSTIVTQIIDHPIYARWTGNPVVVTFNGNNGTPSTQNITQTVGNNYILPSSNPTRTDYTFAGWWTATTGGSQVTTSTQVTQTSAHTLYARWTGVPVTVTFNGNNGSPSSQNVTQTFGGNYVLPSSNPTRTGYGFAGWWTLNGTSTGSWGSQVITSTTVTQTSAHTLYARWTGVSVVVTFNGNNGTPATQNITQTFGNNYILPSSNPTRTGYTFAGWWTATTGGSQVTTSTQVTQTSAHTLYARWTGNPVVVTFNGNNGTPTTQDITQTVGNNYILPSSNPTRTGYGFAGWWTATSGGTQVTTSTQVTQTSGHTLYARWTNNPVSVTFSGNGGTPATQTITQTFGENYTLPSSPTWTGYTFAGWWTLNGTSTGSWGTQVTTSTQVTQTSAHTLYARWTAVQYTVTFNGNNGTPASQTITQTFGENYILPSSNPTRTGYTFAGWWTLNGTSTGSWGSQVITSTQVTQTSAHTLYARWTANTYTVQFNPGAGSGAPYTQGLTYDTAQALASCNFATPAGYVFAGWSTDASQTVTYTDRQSVLNLTAVSGATVTLTAVWTLSPTSVATFDGNGGTPATQDITQTVGNTYILPVSNPARVGYGFANWTLTGAVVNASTVVATATNHTITAMWTPNIYTVRFNGNGGTGTMADQTFTYDAAQALRLNTFTRSGYTFAGWATNGTTVAFSNGQTVSNLTAVNSAIVTLTAQWAVAVTVTFNGNGGIPSSTNIIQTVGMPYVLPVPPPTRLGHTFTGWFTAQTGGTQVTTSTTVTRTDNHTLWARWTANTYTVTFDAQGGMVSPTSKNVTFGTAYGTLPTPTKTDWWFAGWWTGINGTGTLAESSTLLTTEGITLYAYWVDVPPPYLSETDGLGTAPRITTAYDGFVYDANNTVRGTITFNAKAAVKVDKKTNIATTNWTFSAKAVLQNASISFSGKFTGVATRFNVTTKNGETLDVTVEGDRFYGEIKGGKVGGTFKVDGARNVFADKKDLPAQAELNKLRGLYNVALSGRQVVESSGYISLSVGNLGAVKLAGQLSDGTKISGSAKLLEGLNEDGWYAIALHRPLYSKKGFIGGLLWLDPSSRSVRVDTDYDWFVDWVREETDPKKTDLNFTRELDVLGGYFGTGKDTPTVPSGLKFSADVPDDLPPPVPGLTGGMWIDEAFPLGLEVVYGNSGKLSLEKGVAPKVPKGGTAYDYSGVNTANTTLSYTAKTGIFKGSFKLYYDGWDAKGKLQHKTVNVPYTGVMVPDNGVLTGLGTGTATINKVKHGIPVFLE